MTILEIPPITVKPGADNLDAEQAQLGFLPGAPEHITPATQLADARSYQRMKCRVCGAKNRQCRFYHRGQRYRVVAVCRGCGAGETV